MNAESIRLLIDLAERRPMVMPIAIGLAVLFALLFAASGEAETDGNMLPRAI